MTLILRRNPFELVLVPKTRVEEEEDSLSGGFREAMDLGVVMRFEGLKVTGLRSRSWDLVSSKGDEKIRHPLRIRVKIREEI